MVRGVLRGPPDEVIGEESCGRSAMGASTREMRPGARRIADQAPARAPASPRTDPPRAWRPTATASPRRRADRTETASRSPSRPPSSCHLRRVPDGPAAAGVRAAGQRAGRRVAGDGLAAAEEEVRRAEGRHGQARRGEVGQAGLGEQLVAVEVQPRRVDGLLRRMPRSSTLTITCSTALRIRLRPGRARRTSWATPSRSTAVGAIIDGSRAPGRLPVEAQRRQVLLAEDVVEVDAGARDDDARIPRRSRSSRRTPSRRRRAPKRAWSTRGGSRPASSVRRLREPGQELRRRAPAPPRPSRRRARRRPAVPAYGPARPAPARPAAPPALGGGLWQTVRRGRAPAADRADHP